MGELSGVSVAVTNRRSLWRAQRAGVVRPARQPSLALFRIIAVFQIKVAVLLGAGQKDGQLVVETALNIQQDKVADRDIAVERRTEQGNKLYEELITLCNIGKDIWAETDPVKYENYCIYESNNDQKKAKPWRP